MDTHFKKRVCNHVLAILTTYMETRLKQGNIKGSFEDATATNHVFQEKIIVVIQTTKIQKNYDNDFMFFLSNGAVEPEGLGDLATVI